MQLGFVGLGRMGKNMVLHLLEKGAEVVVWNRSQDPRIEVEKAGAVSAETLDDLVLKLDAPRIIWLMVTAGEAVDGLLQDLAVKLRPGDLIIDGGNSYYLDTIRRAEELSKKGIHFMDVGTSGGVESARSGACLMIGGSKEDYDRAEDIFKILAAPGAYGILGAVGAGHFAKMIHNGIEYGMMESIAEGAALLKYSDFKFDLAEVFRIYNVRSIIESRLTGWALAELKKDKDLSDTSSVIGSGGTGRRVKAEGDWTRVYAQKKGIDIPAIIAAVSVRDESFGVEENSPAGFRNKMVSAMRGQFGGHPVKKSGEE